MTQTSAELFELDLQPFKNSLNGFLHEKVKLNQTEYNAVAHNLITFIHRNLGAELGGVSEIVKCGSLGNGTSIKRKVEVDLFVFMQYSSFSNVQDQHKEALRRLRGSLSNNKIFANSLYLSPGSNNHFIFPTDNPIEFNVFLVSDDGDDSVSVYPEMEDFSKEAMSMSIDSFLSLVRDRVQFTLEKPESVKDAIRLIKHWKMRENLSISSYSVEIITIKEWEKMGRPKPVNLKELFRRTMTTLSNMSNINVTWDNSPAGDRKPPVVMDPVDQFHNTVARLKSADRGDVSRKAQKVLKYL